MKLEDQHTFVIAELQEGEPTGRVLEDWSMTEVFFGKPWEFGNPKAAQDEIDTLERHWRGLQWKVARMDRVITIL